MPLAHLGHAELEVTDLEASTRFFTELMGLTLSEEQPGRSFLRAWQDFDHHTLVLTEAAAPGLRHMGWRVPAREDAAEIESRLRSLDVEHSWVEGDDQLGHGDALRFLTPGGLPFELYWEVDYYSPPGEQASVLPSHPQKIARRGAAPRRFDHVTFFVDDVQTEQEWLTEVLGIPHRYYVIGPDGNRWGSWLSKTNISHEIAVTRDLNQRGGQLHHVAYYADSPDEVLRAATMLADHGTPIEWGPGKHATSGATFLYFKEPSGNRVEIWTGGLLIFDPDWKAIEWDAEVGQLGLDLWGSKMPDSFQLGTALPTTPQEVVA